MAEGPSGQSPRGPGRLGVGLGWLPKRWSTLATIPKAENYPRRDDLQWTKVSRKISQIPIEMCNMRVDDYECDIYIMFCRCA